MLGEWSSTQRSVVIDSFVSYLFFVLMLYEQMLGNLKNPPEPFADIIHTHFKLKAHSIKKQLDDWLKEDDARATVADNAGFIPTKSTKTAGNAIPGGSASAFKKDVDELKVLLTQLEREDESGSGAN